MKRKIKSATVFFDNTLNTLAVLAAILLIGMMLMVVVSVTARTIFNIALLGIIEVASIGLLYIAFLTSAWVLRKERHVVMDLVTAQFKPRAQLIINIITSVICALVCLVLVVYGTQVTVMRFQEGTTLYYYLEDLLDAYVLAIIPIGSFFLFIQFLRRIYGYILRFVGLGKPEIKVAIEEAKGF